jgi:hypothetical protein
MSDAGDASIELLLAERAIRRLEPSYCRAVDRLDVDLLRSLFHADGVEQRGGPPANAWDMAGPMIEALRTLFSTTFHTVTQTIIDVAGDHATSESYYNSVVVAPGGTESLTQVFGADFVAGAERSGVADRPHEIVSAGRYLSRYERRDGSWRFTSRLVVTEWNHCAVAGSRFVGGLLGGLNRTGARNRSDPLYALALDGGAPDPGSAPTASQ